MINALIWCNLKKKWLNKKAILALLINNKFKTAGIIASVSFYFIKKRYNVNDNTKYFVLV